MNIIMYHYVRPDNPEYPYFNHLNIDKFRRQLDYFDKQYGFLKKEEFFEAIDKNKSPDGVVLTFDDGFKDHYQYVLPELVNRGLWGLFYVSTHVYQSSKLLGVHRTHYLKGKYGAKQILKDTLELVEDHMLDHETISEFDTEIYTFSGYDTEEKKLRRMFNYYISYEYRDGILDKLMEKYFDEQELHKQVYLSLDEMCDIKNAGSVIGSHTVHHKVLSRLSYQDQASEIQNSFEFLNSNVGLDQYCFCYPYGYKSSYNSDTLDILIKLHVHNAVVFDNRVQLGDLQRYELSRQDCNLFMEV
ncbi:polysaccharide deacetylase family protein [Litoricola sp.]|nr:polysaccharide deacetylase family protein [Litorivicinus sp.]